VVGPVTEGSPEPLGVSVAAGGINVAVHSHHATAIDMCLFDAEGDAETARITLPGRTGPVFHGHIEGVGEGARYGLRARGQFDPAAGQRFNPAKLLVDPYAVALDRPFVLHPSMFAYTADDPRGGDSLDQTDSAPAMPKAIVTVSRATAPPNLGIPWGRTVIYELHVRGFTRTHPDVPEAIRGTFAGLAHPAAIEHLRALGITTVEIMPAAAWIDERHLPPLGLSNYWGYNPVAFMAPDPRLAPGGWGEVRAAVDALAAAGIEAILDVVFNHTGEGDSLGPTLSLRGLDNAGAYRLRPDNPGRYVDDAGTGNTLALDRPAVLRLAMDALRTWRRLGGFSGFRFDLATVLGRRPDGFDPAAPLLAAIAQDPELRGLKLIAEPWDCGPGGYQLGRFPPAWSEWNDRFRDSVRGFWGRGEVPLGDLARRLAGSEDLLAGRRPTRSINFVVAHDGFSLADMVAYGTKHNEANGEENRDGANGERSWNNGVEGASDDPAIVRARLDDQRALLSTLLLARGSPMLSMGAELGHSQGGNNNAYAQDNATGWLDWSRGDPDLLEFTRKLIGIRSRHPALRADRFLTGEVLVGEIHPDVAWRTAAGGAPSAAEWDDPHGRTLVMALAEPAGGDLDRVVLVFHRGDHPIDVVLPAARGGFAWRMLADSSDPDRRSGDDPCVVGVAPRSVVVLAEAPRPSRLPSPGVDCESVDRLAEAAGIAPEWRSLDGERHVVSLDTKLALLKAMGLPAAGRRESLETLHRLAGDQDRPPIPQALTARRGETVRVRLGWDEGAPPPRTWLTAEGEGGELWRLRVDPQACAEEIVACRDGRPGRCLVAVLPPLPIGRYRLNREDRPDLVGRLTVAAPACHAPPGLTTGGRQFGLSAQIYSVRRQGDQGIGDFTTLGDLGAEAARQGAAILAINPLHALFNDRRDRASPYYPSDRRFLDPLYLDVPEIADPGQGFIDYPAVWAAKAAVLERRFDRGVSDPELDAFIDAGGDALARFAAFQAIAELHPKMSWRLWPKDLRNPGGAGVAAFAAGHSRRVRYHQYLQWLCELQLAQAAKRAAGLACGFCRDLAIGAAPDGAEAWANADLLADGVSIGAPPDPLGPNGQVWGLPPIDPHRLRADGYRRIAGLFQANMRHAGALRIDHVMGLARLFWIPEGADGSQGAYVAYPVADLLNELALESERARCLIVGEDLGSVPEGLRDTLARSNVLSYRVLPFEQDRPHHFKPPGDYPRSAFACVSTHDLPPLAGWWEGVDIAERQELKLAAPPDTELAREGRRADKQALVQALAQSDPHLPAFDADGPITPALAAAIHAFLARTPSFLMVAQVEDLAGERTAVNLPGTDTERPNWRRRIGRPLEVLFCGEPAQSILAALRTERPDV